MKYGAIMGGGVGSAAGFLFGSYEAFRYKGIPASQVRATRLCFTLSGEGDGCVLAAAAFSAC